jgi:dihydropteroate synthase
MPHPPSPLAAPTLTLRDRDLIWGSRTYLMGILNVTPDSFSDGGQFDQLNAALAQAQRLAAAGADILDIGGQSTRPQAEEVPLAEELRRVVPVIQAIRSLSASEPAQNRPISVDTTKAAVAEAAVAAGADLVNDISGGTYDPEILPTVARLGVPIVLMHLRGTPKTMQQMTDYPDLIGELATVLSQRAEAAIEAGIARDRIVLDPGIGFAKTFAQNLEILRHLPQLRALGFPLLVGTSRKGFIGHLLDQPDPQQRVWGTAATCCAAVAGGADILRVHDLAEMRDVCRVADALWRTEAKTASSL